MRFTLRMEMEIDVEDHDAAKQFADGIFACEEVRSADYTIAERVAHVKEPDPWQA